MSETLHFFGKTIDGVRCRFMQEYTDPEFEAIVAAAGGTLPPGWFAWHLTNTEIVLRSDRVEAIARLPVVTTSIGAHADPAEMLKRDVEACRCGKCGGLYPELLPVYSGRFLDDAKTMPIAEDHLCRLCWSERIHAPEPAGVE